MFRFWRCLPIEKSAEFRFLPISQVCRTGYFEMHKLELFVVLFVNLKIANSLKCYHCFETLKLGCYSGNNDTMRVANCRDTNESCITYKWETYQRETSNSYVTTSRGCEKEEICKKLMTPKVGNFKGGKEEKGIICQVCKTDLCNRSNSNKDQTTILFFVTISVLILLECIYNN